MAFYLAFSLLPLSASDSISIPKPAYERLLQLIESLKSDNDLLQESIQQSQQTTQELSSEVSSLKVELKESNSEQQALQERLQLQEARQAEADKQSVSLKAYYDGLVKQERREKEIILATSSAIIFLESVGLIFLLGKLVSLW